MSRFTATREASQRRRRLDGTAIFFVVLALITGAATAWLHGGEAFVASLARALGLLVWITPVLLGALLLGAYIQRLVPRETMERWLGRDSGWRGLSLATLAGTATPGGPFTAFPLVAALYQTGAAAPVCITYLTAWAVLGLNRVLVWELPFLGPEFVALRLAVSLPLPFVAGWLATWLERLPR